jgi:hypothetical protein
MLCVCFAALCGSLLIWRNSGQKERRALFDFFDWHEGLQGLRQVVGMEEQNHKRMKEQNHKRMKEPNRKGMKEPNHKGIKQQNHKGMFRMFKMRRSNLSPRHALYRHRDAPRHHCHIVPAGGSEVTQGDGLDDYLFHGGRWRRLFLPISIGGWAGDETLIVPGRRLGNVVGRQGYSLKYEIGLENSIL